MKITLIENPSLNFPRRKRVAAYARVSSDSDLMEHSLSAQVSYYSSLIQRNREWEYAGVYSDYGISGTGVKNRRGFLEMLEDARSGMIDIILTKSISRFARNTVDLLNAVRELKALGVSVRFERENIDTASHEGEMILAILASMAEEEARSNSEAVKWRIAKDFENGKNYTPRTYGYEKHGEFFTIKEDEAAVVRMIFSDYLEGMSPQQICIPDQLRESAEANAL